MFERPEYAVLGRRQYDQRWIDGNVEAGVGACGWQRPAKRPPALDAAPGVRAAPPAAHARPPGMVRRTVNRVLHRSPGAVAPLPQPRPSDLEPQVQPAVVVEEPEPAPPPRAPVDELLAPTAPAAAEPAKKRRCRFWSTC